MAPYNAPQRAAITQFANVTGASQSVAAKYLRNFRWNINAAVDSYLAAASPAATVDTAALNRVFDNYRDDPKNEPNEIGIEGAMHYLEAIEVPLDEVICLGIAELLKSETIGKFKRDDFIGGWASKGVQSLEQMKEHAQILRQQIPATPALYRKVYRYTFPVSREPPARTLPIEIAVEHWQLLFSSAKGGVEMNTPTTPWRDWWLEFYTEKISRPVNKDLWEQVEVFLEKAKEDESLGWHSEDGAWPGALDEFAVFVKAKRGALP